MKHRGDFGSPDVDFAVGIHALRTFGLYEGKLGSVVQGVGHWENGECVARCLVSSEHAPPHVGCNCGIYGFFSVEELFEQYVEFACHVVGVIAVKGLTTIGTKGLKTAAARVVAYWCSDDEAQHCRDSLPGARRFFDLKVMARMYGLNGQPPLQEEGEEDG
jgi:hypothetical protein